MLDSPPRVALAAAVAELNDLVLAGNFDDAQVQSLADEVRGLSSSIVVSERPGDDMRWGDYRKRSPFSGSENPRSPGLSMILDPDVAERRGAIGTVVLGEAFAGRPGVAHGGVVSGLFDEAIGWVAAASSPDQGLVTAKLSVRYRQPTPLQQPLVIHARVDRHTGRRVMVSASCRAEGVETASAEALMVGLR